PGERSASDACYVVGALAPYLGSLPAVPPLPRDVFDAATAERRLAGYFGLATTESFGALSRLELTAAAACISYIERTQLGGRPPLSPPVREAPGATLAIDQATRSNLELVRTLAGERRGSLLAAIDRTVTGAGSRLLAQRLAAPLTDPAAIGRRHDAVEFFVTDIAARAAYRAAVEEGRALRDESRRVIAALQARYADLTSVRALKIRHNNVLGYFIEVAAQHGERMMAAPLNATFIHRQTLAGQVRFTTTELGELEAKIASAADRALGIELETFDKLAAAVTAAAAQIKDAAEALAVLDVAAGLAQLAVERRY